MPTVGGQPGNDNPVRGKAWTSALRRAMAHRGDGDYHHTLLEIAKAVVEKALDGDVNAWKEIADREDGKATQAIEATGNVSVTIASTDAGL